MYKAYVDGSNSLNWCMYGFTWNGKTVITKENTGMTNNITEWLALFSLILYLPNDWAGMVCEKGFDPVLTGAGFTC